VAGEAYVVRPGDTLWSIAASADPTGDPRPLVAQMAARLGTDQVVPGERVVVP
jgi:Tfp pilus assembly protein FimV